MRLFNVRGTKSSDTEIAKKSKTKAKQPVTVKSSGLLATLTQAKYQVEKLLGKYADDYEIITDSARLNEYIENANKTGYIAIDTETTGLDPMLDKIVGLCLYTEGEKGAYIPINHVSYITGELCDNQMSASEVSGCLKLLFAKVIMFNAAFDIRVIRNQLGVYLTCYWDCYLASRLLNENEPKKGLKALHQKYLLNDVEDEFSFCEMFKGITADKIPISTFYLYAAHDAVITYEYWQYQKKYVYYDNAATNDARNGMNGVSWVFFNIEMPCVNVVCDMEDNGIELDLDYAHQLSDIYNERLQAKSEAFYGVLNKYSSQIETYRIKHVNAKIDNPINIASSTQIAILLYDILGVESVDKKVPRGTGEGVLLKISETSDDEGVKELCKAILDYREVSKLLSTYIEKLPNCVNPNDGRIHCKFNQYGADTGRFSSSDPNLQNIPSKNHDVRKMFKASSKEHIIEFDTEDDYIDLIAWNDIETVDGWKRISNLQITDKLCTNDGVVDIRKLKKLNEKTLRIYL